MASSNNTRHKHFYELITTVAVIVACLSKFIKVVAEKGRLVEFFISTPILICTYYALYTYTSATFPFYLIPITVYFLYWSIILTMPKKMKFNSEDHWADEDWWWSLNGGCSAACSNNGSYNYASPRRSFGYFSFIATHIMGKA